MQFASYFPDAIRTSNNTIAVTNNYYITFQYEVSLDIYSFQAR